jgi:hypothetical protein
LNDLVGTLVGIPELNTAWLLDPDVGGATIAAGEATPIATGNQVSCEFSLLCRFHMLISDRDDKWMQGFMKKIIPGKNPATVSSEDYKEGLLAYLATVDKDPSKRSVGGLARGSDGTFDNASLTKILTESTQDCAGNSS